MNMYVFLMQRVVFWNNYNFLFYNGFIIINVIVVYNLLIYQVNDREKINIFGVRVYGIFFLKKCVIICIRLFNRWKQCRVQIDSFIMKMLVNFGELCIKNVKDMVNIY